MNWARYLVFTLDGFGFGASYLRELGSRPGYLIVIYDMMMKRAHNRILIYVLLTFTTFSVLQFFILDIIDTRRYLSHILAFCLFIYVCLSDSNRKIDYKIGAIIYLIILLACNVFPFVGELFKKLFSQSLGLTPFYYGLSSEPSYFGVGVFISGMIIYDGYLKLKKLRMIFLIVTVLVCGYINILVDSKTGILAILLSIIFMAFFKNKKIFYIFSAVLILIVIANFSNIEQHVVNRSFMIRGVSSLCALEIFTQNPLFGVGVAQYSDNIQQCNSYFPLLSSIQEFEYTTSQANRFSTYTVPSRVLAELGVIGFILYVLCICYIFKNVNRKCLLSVCCSGAFISLNLTQDTYLLPFMPVLVEIIRSNK